MCVLTELLFSKLFDGGPNIWFSDMVHWLQKFLLIGFAQYKY